MQEVLRCLLEGMQWLKLKLPSGAIEGRGGISRARKRLGSKLMEVLFQDVCRPLASPESRFAFYKTWRLMAIDGTTFTLPDEKANSDYFGLPPCSRGTTAFPQLRLTAMIEVGTHAITAATHGPFREGENTQAMRLIPHLDSSMLLIADRGFGCYPFFAEAMTSEAALLFRIRNNMKFECEKILPDGSFLSTFYSGLEHRKKINGIQVRVIEYTLKGAKEKYRLITNILVPEEAPAIELAQLYQERWEIEIGYDELKNHLKLPGTNLRSKTPELVIQELYGFFLAHYTVRTLMYKAALKKHIDPDSLSFIRTVRILRRKITSARLPLQSESD